MTNARIQEAATLMQGFAERTGLSPGHAPRRYLWTDAYAVCNYLGLAQATGEARYTELALRLVDQVHHTLGQFRSDGPRSGWLSGLSADEGEHHPTRGGLRIGKALPERAPHESFDEHLEWERDGQYFHYLTKWMHALDQVAQATGQPHYNRWARELARTACAAFTYLPAPRGPRRMYWKMSIDLTRPLVPSMGQHDPLDGYLTCLALQSTARMLPDPDAGPDLAHEISQFAAMLEEGEWATADPLGIGGLLTDACRAEGLLGRRALPDRQLPATLLAAAFTGLQYYSNSGELRLPAEYRLAFRELGLAIGLRAAQHLWHAVEVEAPAATSPEARARLQALMRYAPLCDEIESFWRDPAHHTGAWPEHRDINEVMLATRLAPEGFLGCAVTDFKTVP